MNERDAFEAFYARRKNKGVKRREGMFARLPDDTYVDDSVQRHWWTWQAALAQPAVPQGEPVALQEVGLTRDVYGMCIVTVNGRETIRDNGDVISHYATLDWFARLTAKPPREPLTDDEIRDLVKECGLDWHRGYMPLFDGDPTNRYAVLIKAVEAAERERVSKLCGCREGECESKPTGCRMAAEIGTHAQ